MTINTIKCLSCAMLLFSAAARAAPELDFRLVVPRSDAPPVVASDDRATGYFEIPAYVLGEDGAINVCAARVGGEKFELAKRCDRPHLYIFDGARRASSIEEIPLPRFLRLYFPLADEVRLVKVGALYRPGRGKNDETLLVFYKSK